MDLPVAGISRGRRRPLRYDLHVKQINFHPALSALLVLLMMMLPASSCNLQRQSLPANWPVPQFTIPEGSTNVGASDLRFGGETEGLDVANVWALEFSSERPLDEVVAEIEADLKPSGYLKEEAPQPKEGFLRYLSPDGLLVVNVVAYPPEGKRRNYFLYIEKLNAPAAFFLENWKPL